MSDASDSPNTAQKPQRLLVCINRRFQVDRPSCASRGSEVLAKAVEAGIAERNINVDVEHVVCLGQCPNGPAMRLAPGGQFFLGISENNVPQVLETLIRACGFREEKADDTLPVHLLGS